MAHEISYLVEGRVVLGRVFNDYTFEDARDTNEAIIKLIHSGASPVHLIIDATDVKSVKVGFNQLRETMTMLRDPSIGWIIVVGGNPVARFVASVIMQVGHVNFRFVETRNDALQILQRVDLSINPTS